MKILSPIIFVGGKGGVGKTTISASIASKLSFLGKKTLIISTDPAHSLGDALKIKLNQNITFINENLDAIELDPIAITNSHFENIQSVLKGYADPKMYPKIKEHLKLSQQSPGAQEAAILENICKIITQDIKKYDHVVFDTAPTGHTIRLLMLPNLMSAWTDGLLRHQKDQEKLKNAAKVFWDKKPDYKFNPFKPSLEDRWQKATRILDERKNLFKEASQILQNNQICKVFLVMVPEILPYEETFRTTQELENLQINCGGIFVNQIIPKEQKDDFWQIKAQKQNEILEKIDKNFNNYQIYKCLLSSKDLRGTQILKDLDIGL